MFILSELILALLEDMDQSASGKNVVGLNFPVSVTCQAEID